ncbi:MAG: hypothetical protein M1504_00885 [Candidatus Marsarchaeota archaeon]|nr:hypothetical protein [Candidatus Marsarchaeota archaeon]
MIKRVVIETTLNKYGLPKWIAPYAEEYISGNTIAAIKYAKSFVNFGRKKGMVTKDTITLPNGVTFKKEQVVHLLSLFYYGELRISGISLHWSNMFARDSMQSEHFRTMSEMEAKRARAIKNVISGVGYKAEEPTKELVAVYDYVGSLTSWEEMLVTRKILLNYSYVMPFAQIFYRIFYPVSPEFMRSFGTTFKKKGERETRAEEEAEKIVREGKISRERLLQLTDDILGLVARSIDAEMPNAKRAGVIKEALLLRNISLAFPLHRLNDFGLEIDVDNEIKNLGKTNNGISKK